MSYEGETEYLCTKGHLHVFDCYGDGAPDTCPDCGAWWAWRNTVDHTNGSFDEERGMRIDGHAPLVERFPAPTCPHCGNATEPPRYWIPLSHGRLINEGRGDGTTG